MNRYFVINCAQARYFTASTLVLFFFISFLFSGVGNAAAPQENVKKKSVQKIDPKQKKRLEKIIAAGLVFQSLVVVDYEKALDAFANKKTKERFDKFNKDIWEPIPPASGWSYFMNVSVPTLANAKGKTPLIAYYHPLTDIYLITAWEETKDGARLVDAEIMIGDLVRNRDNPPLNPAPAWLRGDTFKPIALGLAVAQSMKAFEDYFPNTDNVTNWRSKISLFTKKEILEDYNYAVASHNLLFNIVNMGNFREPVDDEDSRLSSLRAATAKAMLMAIEGKTKNLVESADETPERTKKILLKLPPDVYAGFNVIHYLLFDNASIVFLAPRSGEHYYLSFLVRKDGGYKKVNRIDLVSYDGLYTSLSKGLFSDSGISR